MSLFLISTRARLMNGLSLVFLVGFGALVVSGLSRLAAATEELARPSPVQAANRLVEEHNSQPSLGFSLAEMNRANGQTSEEQIEVEVIIVRANGFEPREIIRPHGAFMLAISNHSGTAELALHLDRVQGNRIKEVRLPKGRVRWTQVLNLPPGDYVLSEQNHPNWICRIKLTPR